MFFLIILFLTFISIAVVAAYFSIIGLAATYAGIFWSVVIMGAALEAGKLIAVSALYQMYDQISTLLKIYLFTAIVGLMLITSVGIFGYLSMGYQEGSLQLEENEMVIQTLEEEESFLKARKAEMDLQITQMPDNFVTARQRLMESFAPELNKINARIEQITVDKLELRKKAIETKAHIGPIIYISRVFDKSIDESVKYITLLIIFAFDPLAVALTLVFNVAISNRRKQKIFEATDKKKL